MNYQRDGWDEIAVSPTSVVENLPSPRPSKLVGSTFADPDTLVSRLASEVMGNRLNAYLSDARILVMGFCDRNSSALIQMLRAAGTESCATCNDVTQLGDVSTMHDAFTHIILNLDSFEDIDDAVTALLVFRIRQKRPVVILISDSVSQDDLFQDRKPVCDATLRAPVSFNRLRDGLLAAWTNNKAFINCHIPEGDRAAF
jgi:hypothetical protein